MRTPATTIPAARRELDSPICDSFNVPFRTSVHQVPRPGHLASAIFHGPFSVTNVSCRGRRLPRPYPATFGVAGGYLGAGSLGHGAERSRLEARAPPVFRPGPFRCGQIPR